MRRQHPWLLSIFLLSTLALGLTGCIVGEIEHTVIVEEDGSVHWIASHRAIRSDLDKSEERRQEEEEFLGHAFDDSHPVALGLRALGATDLWTDWVRDRRPFHFETHATYADVASPIEAFLDEAGIVGSVSLEEAGTTVTLTVVIDTKASVEAQHACEETPPCRSDDSPVLNLVTASEASGFRFVLADGEFLEGVGFAVDGDQAELDLETLDWDEESLDPIVLRLEWTTDLCSIGS